LSNLLWGRTNFLGRSNLSFKKTQLPSGCVRGGNKKKKLDKGPHHNVKEAGGGGGGTSDVGKKNRALGGFQRASGEKFPPSRGKKGGRHSFRRENGRAYLKKGARTLFVGDFALAGPFRDSGKKGPGKGKDTFGLDPAGQQDSWGGAGPPNQHRGGVFMRGVFI